MCGIFGIYSAERDLGGYVPNAEKALASMRRRGPDDSGLVRSSHALIGHTRLSIIALQHGKQPLMTEDGDMTITFNGEIFNYRELQRELKDIGISLRTNSDTEVVLEGYKAWGEQVVERLRGMFAFAIYDRRKNEVFAARDRFGIKPFYYIQKEDLFIFSSEARAIYDAALVSFRANERYFDEYLVFGYIAGSDTLIDGIKELRPAHFLKARGKKIETTRYWYPFRDPAGTGRLNRPEKEVVMELEGKILDAFKSWAIGDVSEVAILLSGGVDSSLVTQITGQVIDKVKTCTAYFPNDAHLDERHLTRLITDKIKGEVFEIPLTDEYLIANLSKMTAYFDEPIHDANGFTLMAILDSLRQRSDVKVISCGEGSDETFGGYGRHRTLGLEYDKTKDENLIMYAMNRVAIPRLELFTDAVHIDNRERRQILEGLRSTEGINRVLENDQQTFLTAYLTRQDRVGSYFGMEIRTPFLDHHLAEYVNSLPSALKINQTAQKYILRKVAERHLPHEIVWNRSKYAFIAPVSRMFRNGALRDLFLSIMTPGARISSRYRMEGVLKLLSMHDPEAGQDHSNTLWRLLALELWLRSWK